jgi:hypothetical protein
LTESQHRQQLIVHFPLTSLDEANVLAASLRDWLLDDVPGIDIRRRRTDSSAQDFGASLVIILGTPAVLAIAKGIQAWLTKSGPSAEMEIVTTKGKVTARQVKSQDALELARILTD